MRVMCDNLNRYIDVHVTQYMNGVWEQVVAPSGPDYEFFVDDDYGITWERRFYNKHHTKFSYKPGTDVTLIPSWRNIEYKGEARVDSRDVFNKTQGRKIAGKKALSFFASENYISYYERVKIWKVLLPKLVTA
jgi:hypothetical protein